MFIRRKRPRRGGPPPLAFITCGSLSADSNGTLVRRTRAWMREIRLHQTGDVDVMVAPELMRVLAEERHQFYGEL